MRQLVLPFAEEPEYAAEDFLWGEANAGLRALLERAPAWSNLRLVVWGAPGVGKTHLAHLWAAQSGALVMTALGLRTPPIAPPDQPLAIDDADAAISETALFHTLNAAREAGLPVLLTARVPPARAAIALPDLASRLRASSVAELAGPDDRLLAMLLDRLAAERQLAVPEPVKRFLLDRLPREAAALREAVARLDRASLAAGRAVGRGLAGEIVAAMAEGAPLDAAPDDGEALSICHSPGPGGFL